MLEENKIPMVAPAATATNVTVDPNTGKTKEYVFRVCFIDPFQGNYCNARLDELVNKANVETDKEKRRAILQEVERIAYEDAAYVPLH